MYVGKAPGVTNDVVSTAVPTTANTRIHQPSRRRDRTLIEEVGYLDRSERVELYPWAVDAIRALNRAHIPIVIVSNQSGIARGFFTEATVDEVHQSIEDRLRLGGAQNTRLRTTIVRTIRTDRCLATRGCATAASQAGVSPRPDHR